jgi:acyltransferase-like protein
MNAVNRYLYLDRLRLCLILLIVLEHCTVGYTSAASINLFDCYQSDWMFLDRVALDDRLTYIKSVRLSFAIPALFFISGLFVVPGVRRHGIATYTRRRILRLGLPLVLIACLLTPLMYYIPCQMSWVEQSFLSYLKEVVQRGFWPIAHGWFLWILLLFECIVLPFISSLLKLKGPAQINPFPLLFCLMILIYLAALIGSFLMEIEATLFWRLLSGPFDFFAPEIFVSLVFFLCGVYAGALMEQGKFGLIEQKFFKQPFLWIGVSMLLLWGQYRILPAEQWSMMSLYSNPVYQLNQLTTPLLYLVLTGMCLSCFYRWFNNEGRAWQVMCRTSYTIYVLHFPISVWVSWFMLDWSASAILKISVASIFGVATPIMLSMGVAKIRETRSKHWPPQYTVSNR